LASPVYHREDLLPRKTGLTFSDSLLVKPRDQDQVESFKEYFKGLEKDVTVTSKVEGTDLYRLRIKDPKHENALDIAEHLAQSPLIEYVGQDWLQLTSAISTTTPNDTYYANQWPIAKIDASNGWDLSTGSSSVVIAILDTGCDLNDEDLSAKYVPIGNRHDVVDNTNTPNDDLGHGTCCAGISAAQSNNNLGFVGVAWNCKIMSIRMLE
jgi:thermitase